MIRINLLGGERLAQKKRLAFSFDTGQRVAFGAVLIVIVMVGVAGLWFLALDRQSVQVDIDIASAQQQARQLAPLLREVEQFEQRKVQLQQRVGLIQQLRGGQSVPVQLLDHVSRSMPDMLWLTQLNQEKGEMTIEGRSTTLIALSDFVGNLGETTLLQKPVEIVSSQVESVQGTSPQAPPVDVIKFTVKAQLKDAGGPEPGVTPAKATAATATRGAAR